MARSAWLKLTLLACLLGQLLGGPLRSAQAEEELAERGVALVNAVVDSHIKPISKQELVLAGLLEVYSRAEQVAPSQLGNEVSALSSDAELAAFYDRQLTELAGQHSLTAPSLHEEFLTGVLKRVPGGAHLIPADEAAIEDSLAANKYVGVGIALSQIDFEGHEYPIVSRLFVHGPGAKAGMLEHDMILEVDGVSTDGKSLKEYIDMLRGIEGSDVTLKLQQAGHAPRDLTITRGVTFIPTVEGLGRKDNGEFDYRIPKHEGYVYLRIVRMGPSTAHELKKIEAELRREKLSGIILDLSRGGGRLHDAVLVADQLLDACELGHAQFRDSSEVFKTSDGKLFQDVPMCVIVGPDGGDDRTLVAKALLNQGRATISGMIAFREPLIRSHITLGNGDRLQIPTGLLHCAGEQKLQAMHSSITAADIEQQRAQPQARLTSAIRDALMQLKRSQANAKTPSKDTAQKNTAQKEASSE